ncbi:MAG: putative enzyme of heme biosynthesis [Proteobacteria bacterium]|nr:putative enzyme of heme biosynthesis [Pseudomonadota bacterium]
MNDIADQPSAAPPPAPTSPPASGAWKNPWLIIALLALALAGWQWVETRLRLADTQQELARRLSESDTLARESRMLAKQAQEQLAVLQGKFGELEAKIAESKSQQTTLESLYQDLARGRDEWALAEVEQGVTLAAQQLQLAANVQGAVLALQSADARLAGSSRPQFIGLRKVLARDLDRLRALPQIDLPGMNLQLESVISAVDTLPLAVDVRPRDERQPAAPAAPPDSLAFWQQLALEFWGELRGLIRIQRFDRDEPALLAPQQVFFLRENLKLRLLNARLALLAHDQWTFRNELAQARVWVDRYFDGRDPSVQAAQRSLKQLAAAEINIELPNLNESLSAIKSFKLGKERK